ncbi:MAG: hypothetical protein AAF720_01875 [Pseudomonadota bacterium]
MGSIRINKSALARIGSRQEQSIGQSDEPHQQQGDAADKSSTSNTAGQTYALIRLKRPGRRPLCFKGVHIATLARPRDPSQLLWHELELFETWDRSFVGRLKQYWKEDDHRIAAVWYDESLQGLACQMRSEDPLSFCPWFKIEEYLKREHGQAAIEKQASIVRDVLQEYIDIIATMINTSETKLAS